MNRAQKSGTTVIATDTGMRPEGTHLIGVSDKEGLVRQIRSLTHVEKNTRSENQSDNTNIKAVIDVYDELAIYPGMHD